MYDLIIIGAGWAGLNAALTAKKYGLKAVLIEQGRIGGVCLNQGCIPTKTLLQSVKMLSLAKKFPSFGIEGAGQVVARMDQMQKRKEKIIQQLARGMEYMIKGVEYVQGCARIVSADTVEVDGKSLKARYILIATGSKPAALPQMAFDAVKIMSSDQLIDLQEIPASLLIIGGGVIGCEFASLFAGLGSKVTIVELMDQLIPGEDKEVAGKLEVLFKKRNITVLLNQDAAGVDAKAFDRVLVSIGRKADCQGLGVEKLGIQSEKGRVIVDGYLRTAVPTIFAAGDCIGTIMLAHFAAYQGRMAVENMVHPDNPRQIDMLNVPAAIFTDPEIASVGLTADQAVKTGIQVKVDKFDFLGSGMARILDETDGFIKVVSDNSTGRILGAAMIGPKVTEIIGIISAAVINRLTVSDIKKVILPHPTLSESISEALH
jgi:dihydrolipoamide dehydrogenase